MNVKNVTNFVVKNDTINEYLKDIVNYGGGTDRLYVKDLQ